MHHLTERSTYRDLERVIYESRFTTLIVGRSLCTMSLARSLRFPGGHCSEQVETPTVPGNGLQA